MSFNIGRIRQPSEPYQAAWSPLCGEPDSRPDVDHSQNFVSKEFVRRSRCSVSAGCQNVERQVINNLPKDAEKENDDGYLDRSSNDEFVYESEEDNEPFEYESDSDLMRNEENLENKDFEDECIADESGNEDALEGGSDQSAVDPNAQYQTREHSRSEGKSLPSQSPTTAYADSLSPEPDSDSNWHDRWIRCQKLEHLAGPGCSHHRGYSGYRITAEQMKGCATAQCLVRKTAEWRPEPDDQSFELEGDFFLSGLSGLMPSSDVDSPEFWPVRHGVGRLEPDIQFRTDVSRGLAQQSLCLYYETCH